MFRRIASAGCVALLVVAVLAGCTKKPEDKIEPKVKPPAIAQAGTIKVGVDLSTPPFGGVDSEMKAGIDVDVAAAIADRLGLRVEYVDVAPSDAATALASGRVDAVLSVRLDTADLTKVTAAGTYLSDAPGLFISTDSTSSIEPSITLDTLPSEPIAAQTGSEAFWILRSELESDSVVAFGTLRAAFEALDAGEVTMLAGDAMVGAYIGRDFPTVHLAGQLADTYPLSAVVAAENTALSDAVRTALDELAADGVLDSIRRKWVGDLPELTVADEPTEDKETAP